MPTVGHQFVFPLLVSTDRGRAEVKFAAMGFDRQSDLRYCEVNSGNELPRAIANLVLANQSGQAA